MKRWMDAIDEEWLEEVQRPLPRFSGVRRWGALAACFCAAALAAALWLPGRIGDRAAGSDNGRAGTFAAGGDTQPLSATLVLPADAELAADPQPHRDESGAVTSVSCTVTLGGSDYDYGAAYAAGPLAAPDGAMPSGSWQVGPLTLLLYDDGAVGWYDAECGVQWYCVPLEDGQPLVTAFAMMDAQSYTVPAPPAGAEVLGYDLFDRDGSTVTEVTFVQDGSTWCYRMAPTADVSDTIPDISAFTGGTETAESLVAWCPAVLRWDEGGAGCILWRDMAPGLVYSLTADSGASETVLQDMAALVFRPAQDEA